MAESRGGAELRRITMRALVVDDSRAMRMIVKSVLEEAGFEVLEAENGLSALDRLNQAGSVDLATVDWNMPEMNGLDFVTAIRANESYAGMRVMMITTETELEQMEKAMLAGANEYLMKPFTRDLLLGKLDILGLRSGS